ncbi:MAG: NUDIX domain-containing protein [Myxococcales bacterium]|nr:NUDIX domain-containing protein [Myxococcales bacterium]
MASPTHAGTLCYRRSEAGALEFLLVRTSRGDRWVIPKGRIDPGEKSWEAAARETVEESGWYGPIDARELLRFRYFKPRRGREDEVVVHLLAAAGHRAPHERRAQCWASPDDARRRLAEGRSPRHASELAAVIDRGVAALGETPREPGA